MAKKMQSIDELVETALAAKSIVNSHQVQVTNSNNERAHATATLHADVAALEWAQECYRVAVKQARKALRRAIKALADD